MYSLYEQYKGGLQSLPCFGYYFTLLDEHPGYRGSNLFDVEKNFYFQIFFWAMIFYISSLIFICAAEFDLFPQKFAQAKMTTTGAERIRWLQPYIASIMHHIINVTLSVTYIYNDWNLNASERANVDYTKAHSKIIVLCLGYFVQDFFLYAIPKGDVTYIIHHASVIFVIVLCLQLYMDMHGFFFKYVTYMMMTETSSIFFSVAWVLRTFGIQTGKVFCEVAFGVCFFFFRILCLPILVNTFLSSNNQNNLLVHLASYTILVLQFYWMVCILQSALRKLKKYSSD